MMRKQGFTLVEIMIVVLIIGLLAAIAIPNFMKARLAAQKSACIDNLRLIISAVEQAKMEGISDIDKDVLYGGDKFIKVEPRCGIDKEKSYDLDDNDAVDWIPECPNKDAWHTSGNYNHELD